jgi:hypothetical protein
MRYLGEPKRCFLYIRIEGAWNVTAESLFDSERSVIERRVEISDENILAPGDDDRPPGDDGMTLRELKGGLRAGFQKWSIARYIAVFGAIPDKPPYRQWLSVRRDHFIHIADLWKDPQLRADMLARLQQNRRAYKLRYYLERDLKYLDEFAAQLSAKKMARLPPPYAAASQP